MTLPAGIDPSKIQAKVKQGAVEVMIPLSAGSKKAAHHDHHDWWLTH
jgi:HSP20 family molecular chaperone IbpA